MPWVIIYDSYFLRQKYEIPAFSDLLKLTYFLFHFLKLILKIFQFWQISLGVSRIFEFFWKFCWNEPLCQLLQILQRAISMFLNLKILLYRHLVARNVQLKVSRNFEISFGTNHFWTTRRRRHLLTENFTQPILKFIFFELSLKRTKLYTLDRTRKDHFLILFCFDFSSILESIASRSSSLIFNMELVIIPTYSIKMNFFLFFIYFVVLSSASVIPRDNLGKLM